MCLYNISFFPFSISVISLFPKPHSNDNGYNDADDIINPEF